MPVNVTQWSYHSIKFKNLLDSRKMTCYALAKKSGISYTAVNELRRGERKIDDCSLKAVRALADALEMPLDDFVRECDRRMEIPECLYKCFRDTDVTKLRVGKNNAYIITRLLDAGGYDGFVFLKKAYTYEEMKSVGRTSRNFSPRLASVMENLFHLKKSEMAFYTRPVSEWRK